MAPLPVRDGLNPSRVRLPLDVAPTPAIDFVRHLIDNQRHRAPGDDEAALLARFEANEVVDLQGRPFAPDDLVSPGADIWFYRMPAAETPVPYDILVLHHDDDLLVIDKPPYLATMPRGRHITETALVKMRRATGNPNLTPAHRLDRLTSGILVMTTRQEVRGAYQTLFARREATKTYEAIARYEPSLVPDGEPTVWESRIEKNRGDIASFVVDGPPNARTRLLSVEPVTADEQRKLEEVHGPLPQQGRYKLAPETGKTHQLRVHMRDAGVPILGDPVYPIVHPLDAEDMTIPMHLIARTLEFIDPLSRTRRIFRSDREMGSM